MAEVVGLRGAVPQGEPVSNVVAALEHLLERARRGEVRAVAYAVVSRDGSVATAWEKPVEPGQVALGFDGHALASGILTLGWRYGAASDAR